MAEVPSLKVRARPGTYARGLESVEQILGAALTVLVDEGYRALTLRRIAAECGLKVGNVTYYFPTKDALVRELLDSVLNGYEDVFLELIERLDMSDEQKLDAYVRLILDDILTKRTTHLFPELWAMSNYDAVTAQRVDELYVRARSVLVELIGRLNPALDEDERQTLALFISASLEGLTVFAGHKKPWSRRMPWLANIASKSAFDLITTITPDDVRGLDRREVAAVL
ncbi:TetR/AcrR family transcriptional regulator [Parapedomonas caeni]